MLDIRSIPIKAESFSVKVAPRHVVLGLDDNELAIMERTGGTNLIDLRVWAIRADKPIPDVCLYQKYHGKALVGLFYCHIFAEVK